MAETSKRRKRQGDPLTSTEASEAGTARKRRRKQDAGGHLGEEPHTSAEPRWKLSEDKGGESVLDTSEQTAWMPSRGCQTSVETRSATLKCWRKSLLHRWMLSEGKGGESVLDTSKQPVNQARKSTGKRGKAKTSASSKAKDCLDAFSRLPHLCQDEIIGHLKVEEKIAVAQVCSAWRQAVYRPYHWPDKDYIVSADQVDSKTLSSPNKGRLRRLKVIKGSQKQIARLLRELSSLINLSLVTEPGANAFFDKLSQKDSLELSKLRDLELVYMEREQAEHFQTSLTKMPQLKSLSLGSGISSDLIKAMAAELSCLEGLRFTGGQSICIKQLVRLRDLDMEASSLTDFSEFCSLAKQLKTLKMHLCKLSCENWLADVARLSSLEELDLMHCLPDQNPQQDRLKPLIQALQRLKKLKLCPASNDDVKSVAHMRTLEEVDLVCFRTNLSEETLQLISQNLTQLKSFSLRGDGDHNLKALADMSSLQRLMVADGSWIRDFLQTVNQTHCNLTSLEVRQFSHVRANDLENISKISTLRELTLKSMTTRFLWLLNGGEFSLEILELRSCGGTLRSLMPLFEKQVSLKKLIVIGPKVEEWMIPSVTELLPELRYYRIMKRRE